MNPTFRHFAEALRSPVLLPHVSSTTLQSKGPIIVVGFGSIGEQAAENRW
jgi:hypothetical protein